MTKIFNTILDCSHSLCTYLSHIHADCKLVRADHHIKDGCSPFVDKLAGLPCSFVTNGTLAM